MKETSDSFPRNTLRQAELAREGWKDLINNLNVPNLTLENFEQKIKKATAKVDLAEKLKEYTAILESSKSIINKSDLKRLETELIDGITQLATPTSIKLL